MADVPHQKSPLLPDRLLHGAPHDHPIEHIFGIAPQLPRLESEKTLVNFVLPPWSHGADWNKDRQARFIENIFLGVPLNQANILGAISSSAVRWWWVNLVCMLVPLLPNLQLQMAYLDGVRVAVQRGHQNRPS